MPFITADDGARIFYKDWGSDGTPVLLSHGWPLNADAWDAGALFLATHGHRAVAHDRRGHGRSTQSWHGNEMDTYADDLATLIESDDPAACATVHPTRPRPALAARLDAHCLPLLEHLADNPARCGTRRGGCTPAACA